jgi:hypothetical protein
MGTGRSDFLAPLELIAEFTGLLSGQGGPQGRPYPGFFEVDVRTAVGDDPMPLS